MLSINEISMNMDKLSKLAWGIRQLQVLLLLGRGALPAGRANVRVLLGRVAIVAEAECALAGREAEKG